MRAAYARSVVPPCQPALEAAFAHVPRERFLGPPPWPVHDRGPRAPPTDDLRTVYRDVLVGLLPGTPINNGQPSLHAACMAAACVARGETVLHVGAGGGYYTALLAELVGRSGRVEAWEVEPVLAERARAALAPWPWVRVHAASALAPGTSLPRADFVYASAGATHPPAAWLDALAPGGRLILPLTDDAGEGAMLFVGPVRPGRESQPARWLMRVSFIDCAGARRNDEARALRAAFGSRRIEGVRRLHRGMPPGANAWVAGADWWLEADAAP